MKNTIDELLVFIEYLEDKVEECYKNEVKIIKKRLYARLGIKTDE